MVNAIATMDFIIKILLIFKIQFVKSVIIIVELALEIKVRSVLVVRIHKPYYKMEIV